MSEAQPPAGSSEPPAQPPGSAGPWGDPSQSQPQQWAPPPYQAVTPIEQPQSILTAVRLMWVGAGFAALSIILTFIQTGELRDQIRDSDSSLTADEVDTAIAVILTISVVVGVIVIGLWLWMAAMNGKGRSWARVVATVLGALNVLFTALNFFNDQLTPLNAALSVVGIALAVTILVLLYRPESTAYYDYKTRTGM